MNGYSAIFKIRTKALFQYRAAAIAGICTQLFWGIVQVMIFRAFFIESFQKEPISLQQTVTFIWIGQALLLMLPWNIDKELEGMIRSGNVAYELVRPLHLYGFYLARSLAMRLVPTLMRCIPVFAIGGWLFDLSPPVSWQAGLAFLFSVLLALVLSSAMTTLVMISLFWTLSGEGILRLLPACVALLSGLIVPLPLFPSWIKPFLNLQPFRGVVDIPARLYTGVIPTSESPYYFLFQIAWTALFIFLGLQLMRRATRRFVIQGG
jgi:ABC-2 type transport system permease protein